MVDPIISQYFSAIGRKGGNNNNAKKATLTKLKKYGPDYFKNIRKFKKS